MQDRAPANRAERRAAARKKQTATRAPLQPRPSPSPIAHPSPATAGGAPFADSAEAYTAESEPETADLGGMDFLSAFAGGGATAAPERKVSHKRGAGKQTRVWNGLASYYAFAGLIVGRFNMADGQLIMGRSTQMADAWIEVGKSNPEVMRVLELITVAGPYTGLLMIHAELALGIMGNHQASPLSLFSRSPKAPPVDEQQRSPSQSAPLPYQPAGAFAPTEASAPPPIMTDTELRLVPDEGIPEDIDRALRQMARQSGRPYEELKQEALVELAQLRMHQNGHHHTVAPGALGAPVARE